MLSKPFGLRCDLFRSINAEKIISRKPKFSWCMKEEHFDSKQSKYHILVSTEKITPDNLFGDMWDSTVVDSSDSLHIVYDGEELVPDTEYYWSVRLWNQKGEISAWSDSYTFKTDKSFSDIKHANVFLQSTENEPVIIDKISNSHWFIAFEKAVFGTLNLDITSASPTKIIVHLGEDSVDSKSVNRNPGGTIRYKKFELSINKGSSTYRLEITPDKRNTGNCAILMPSDIGEVYPFRFCEIEQLDDGVEINKVSQIMVHLPFDDSASYFSCSDADLNKVWDLCKYTIKATSFCGYYVDGDRERIPYEADAYINQLSHYCVDAEYMMARRTHEYLIKSPTWPTEWILHSVLMAWADYMFTGDADSLFRNYNDLKKKSLLALAREDGLISTMTGLATAEVQASVYLVDKNNPMITSEIKDIVDWPPGSFTTNGTGERDDYEMKEINTVVNSFHYYNLVLLEKIAAFLKHDEDQIFFKNRAELVGESILKKLFNSEKGLFVDGEGSSHISLHANMFPLAFGLVPDENKKSVAEYLKSRGMVCSVYGAQYLLEALCVNGCVDTALQLMTAKGTRGWLCMLEAGATMTLEAWHIKYKNNLDWNHAWGTAPANIIPMYIMGIRPLEAGFKRVMIHPQLSALNFAKICFPTIRGPILLSVSKSEERLEYELEIPANVEAEVFFPIEYTANSCIEVNAVKTQMIMSDSFAKVCLGSGKYKMVGSRLER